MSAVIDFICGRCGHSTALFFESSSDDSLGFSPLGDWDVLVAFGEELPPPPSCDCARE